MALLVLVINYNNAEETLRCLDSISLCDEDVHIRLVDNGSNAEDIGHLKNSIRKHLNLELTESKVNLGFSGGVNLGLHECHIQNYEYILLLNNDATVEPDALRLLTRALDENPEIGGVNPAIFDSRGPEGKVWFGGGVLHQWAGLVSHNRKLPSVENDEFDRVRVIPNGYLNGCCLLIRRTILENLNGLDENLFMYGDDVDLSYRMREKGWKLGFVPTAIAHHNVSASTGQSEVRFNSFRAYYDSRNWILIQRKRGYKGIIPIISQILIITPYHIVLMISEKTWGSITWYIRGLIDGLMNRVGRRTELG
tara:strand:+ start:1588 stop:2514 length:927 start_codon:yes stop_codon:yes gene_type:complete